MKEKKGKIKIKSTFSNSDKHDQDNRREPGLAGYAMWKSDTKSAA